MTSALVTDFYELTMMQGFFLEHHNPRVVFDMFYRNNPFNGGYTIFTGLEDLIEKLENFRFSPEDIQYLRSLNKFQPSFLEYLESYSFSGDLYAFDEGTPAFPQEPLIRIETNMLDAQLIESLILNTINFQTLIATKASRMSLATKGRGSIMEFGLRRAQGIDGALSASRACYIGGCDVTSNTLAGKKYGIPVAGTMAHSWIMLFGDEYQAFRAFADIYPDNCILLIDTYDTLGSGIEAAIKVGLEQKAKGKKIGIRIDSGDLSYLTKAARAKLDEAGLEDATICVSNDLNEQIILTLINDGAPIDSWGIGTHLVTGGNQAALGGVYKLAAKKENGVFIPTLKISSSYEKTTNPGIKQVYRFFDKNGQALADLITLDSEKVNKGENHIFYHPFSTQDMFVMRKNAYQDAVPLLKKQMENGKRIAPSPTLKEIQESSREKLSHFDKSYKRQVNPHIYKVSLSTELKNLKGNLILQAKMAEEKI